MNLGNEYKESLRLLSKRINELKREQDKLTRKTKNPHSDADVIDIAYRLKPLLLMQKDLIEVTREVIHYYDKGWWRSEKYTFNQRKSIKYVYVEPIYD